MTGSSQFAQAIGFLVAMLVVYLAMIVIRHLLGVTSTDLPPTAVSLEGKLETLAKCGLRLAEPFQVRDLLVSWNREQFEKPGYDLVLVGLGMTEEKEPWRPHCRNLWHFDTECIEDDGDYQRIALRLSEMTAGGMVLEDVRDHVDLEAGQAWLSFRQAGKTVKLNCVVQDDWVDTAVLARIADRLRFSCPGRTFFTYDLGGQALIIGCVTRQEFEGLQGLDPKFQALPGEAS